MVTKQESSVAPDGVAAELKATVELKAIEKELDELVSQWQQCVKAGECSPQKSSEYYDKAAKLIQQKRELVMLMGQSKTVPVPEAASPTPAAEPTLEPPPAPPVHAEANGSPPKKVKKKKAAKSKAHLAMTKETDYAVAPSGQTNAPVDPGPTMPVIDSYGDAQALADGVLVDVSPFKVEIKGVPVTRMTATIFARMSKAVKEVEAECAQAQVPFILAVAERNWMVSQMKQAVIKGNILQVPRTPTSGAIWIMENETGGFTMLSPSDY